MSRVDGGWPGMPMPEGPAPGAPPVAMWRRFEELSREVAQLERAEHRREVAMSLALNGFHPGPGDIPHLRAMAEWIEQYLHGHYLTDRQSPSGKTLCRCGDLHPCPRLLGSREPTE